VLKEGGRWLEECFRTMEERTRQCRQWEKLSPGGDDSKFYREGGLGGRGRTTLARGKKKINVRRGGVSATGSDAPQGLRPKLSKARKNLRRLPCCAKFVWKGKGG